MRRERTGSLALAEATGPPAVADPPVLRGRRGRTDPPPIPPQAVWRGLSRPLQQQVRRTLLHVCAEIGGDGHVH
jgi:hypothetical protein